MLKLTLTLEQMEHCQDLLSFPEGKDRDQDRSPFIKSLCDRGEEPSFLCFSGITCSERSIASGCLNNKNIYVPFREIGASHQRLLQKIHIASVKHFFPFGSKENPCRSQDMAGVIHLECNIVIGPRNALSVDRPVL